MCTRNEESRAVKKVYDEVSVYSSSNMNGNEMKPIQFAVLQSMKTCCGCGHASALIGIVCVDAADKILVESYL